MLRIAAVQIEPSYMDPAAGIAAVRSWVEKAAAQGVTLAVFPELLVPGYPRYVPDPFPQSDEGEAAWEDIQNYQRRYLAEAQVVPGPITEELGAIAHEFGVAIVIGLAEKDPVVRGRMWNTAVTIDRDGRFVGKRRKVVSVMHERMYFDRGDLEDLRVFTAADTVIGTAICFENHHPLVRRSFGSLGEQLHCALWTGPVTRAAIAAGGKTEKHLELAIAHALDTGTFVATSSQVTPKHLEKTEFGSTWPQTGGTYIVGPDGSLLASVPDWEEGMAIADLDFDVIDTARLIWNPFGEDERVDLFGRLPSSEGREHRADEVTAGALPVPLIVEAHAPTPVALESGS